MLGHDLQGQGARGVIVLNDWLCDTSTWDGARAYLDGGRFTYAFADLRGYGRSKEQAGSFTIEEAAADVLALADALGWRRFAIVGHSMSSLIALHLGQHAPDRIERVVVLTPPPPAGMGADDATLAYLHAAARADDETRLKTMRHLNGGRLSEGWTAFKAARWRATANPEAVAAYATMYARRGLPEPTKKIAAPILAVTGEKDAEPMRRAPVSKLLAPLAEGDLTVVAIAESGHYPMQEAPPLLVAIVERFLAADPTRATA